jgi:GAF domain-containing protein
VLVEDARRNAYRRALDEIRAVTEGENDAIANLANAAAILFGALRVSWVGFYRVRGRDLVLGPFQGKVACVRIEPGRGVCGAARDRNETVVVPDVHAFPGHIACDPESRAEIVVPLRAPSGSVWGVLDVDSRTPGDFDGGDAAELETIARLLDTVVSRDPSFFQF